MNDSRYIAYRSQSDSFQIHFWGGPLDGQIITTDVCPENDYFVHHVNGRDYVYRYESAAPGNFRAVMHGFEIPQRQTQQGTGIFGKIRRLLSRLFGQ